MLEDGWTSDVWSIIHCLTAWCDNLSLLDERAGVSSFMAMCLIGERDGADLLFASRL